MPVFEIQHPSGKTFEVEAPDMNAALAGLNQHMGAQDQQAPSPQGYTMLGSAARGIQQGATLGFADEWSGLGDAGVAGLSDGIVKDVARNVPLLPHLVGGVRMVFGDEGAGKAYDVGTEREREENRKAQEANPWSYGASEFGGGLVTGLATGGAGAKAAIARAGTTAATGSAGRSFARLTAGGAIDGAVMGALNGFGTGKSWEERKNNAMFGGALGGLIGGAAPLVVTGVQKGVGAVSAPIMARLRPEAYADDALVSYASKAGLTKDDILTRILGAQSDGQNMFAIADAMGHHGERVMSTLARMPHEARQQVVDNLIQRQKAQGERLALNLAEAFDATKTAQQTFDGLKAARTTASNVHSGAVRNSADAVDISKAIQVADDFLGPDLAGKTFRGSGIAPESIEDTFMQAVRKGQAAASQAVRKDDSIPAFMGLKDAERAAFRTGYADPYIAQVEASSLSPMVNKASPLMTPKTQAEFPAFAANGKGEQLLRRIAREDNMFRTANAALRVSKTAGNLADMARSDAVGSIVQSALTGSPRDIISSVAGRALNEIKGISPQLGKALGSRLMESDPRAVAAMFDRLSKSRAQSETMKQRIYRAIIGGQAAVTN